MQWNAIFCFAAMLLASVGQAAAPAEPLEKLGWLSGTWKLESKGRLIEEQWTTPVGGTMIGMSRTIANGKTVAFEFLRIEVRGEDTFYIAQPQGRPATEFRLISSTADEWVFANPQHDFPKKIRYRRNPDGSATARIEDETGKKFMEFPFQRAK